MGEKEDGLRVLLICQNYLLSAFCHSTRNRRRFNIQLLCQPSLLTPDSLSAILSKA